MRILLIPPDGRPCNTQLPRAVAATAGHELYLPPADPRGDPAGALDFLAGNAPLADAIVVSVDAVVHGSGDRSLDPRLSLASARSRLSQLTNIIAPHAPRTTLFSYLSPETVAPTSEKTLPLSRDLLELNRLRARPLSAADSKLRDDLLQRIPKLILDHYDSARARNYEIQSNVIEIIKSGAAARAFFFNAGAEALSGRGFEESRLREAAKNLNIQFLPGGDSAGAILTAAAVLDDDPQVFKTTVILSDAPGIHRRALYEYLPFRETFHLHMRPLGLIVEQNEADFELYIHPPVPNSADLFYDQKPQASLDLAQFISLIKESVDEGRPAALIDCGHTNGSDIYLMNRMSQTSLAGLTTFSAGNTASCAVGAGLAHAAMAALGRKTGQFNITESRRLLWLGLLDNYLFQTIARFEFRDRCIQGGIDRFQFDEAAAELNAALDTRLHELAGELLPFGPPPFRARFPLGRLLECEIEWL